MKNENFILYSEEEISILGQSLISNIFNYHRIFVIIPYLFFLSDSKDPPPRTLHTNLFVQVSEAGQSSRGRVGQGQGQGSPGAKRNKKGLNLNCDTR